MVKSIVDLLHRLGLSVTAEGVERQEQADLLRAWGCAYAQGHHFASARSADELVEWLERRGERARG